jgi:hypothetical protein
MGEYIKEGRLSIGVCEITITDIDWRTLSLGVGRENVKFAEIYRHPYSGEPCLRLCGFSLRASTLPLIAPFMRATVLDGALMCFEAGMSLEQMGAFVDEMIASADMLDAAKGEK